jgi:light-regulated signal transduction histidine kinase (bacteriophytochrome)
MVETPAELTSFDLTNCDREPIHIPGLIQPHGVLLVLREPDLDIIQMSRNTQAILGQAPEELLGQPLAGCLPPAGMQQIQQCLAADFEGTNPLDLTLEREAGTLIFDGILHRWDQVVLLELEPRVAIPAPDFFDFYHQVKDPIARLQKAPTLLAMCQVAVKEIRRITGFDRVMVYRFDDDGTGVVIAEDTDQDHPYLDLHYPASDIPQQARHLYTQNWLRLIPDAHYHPVGLMPEHNPVTGQPLDLSQAVLRSVSPLHLEYLENMGVTASMSISLLQNQQLWGLIACHHSSPQYIPYAIRTICEFIAQVMSAELMNKAAQADIDHRHQIRGLQAHIIEALSKADTFFTGMVALQSELLALVDATGAVVCHGEQSFEVGATPSQEAVRSLLEWLKPHLQKGIFATRSLPQLYPPAQAYQGIASGLLALEISRLHHNYILWFRPEVIQTVNWGGNPHKPVEVAEDGELRMSPRQSFALWQEEVKGTALPWQPYEVEAVSELRNLIVGIVLRQAEAVSSMNFELKRSNEDLDSFAYIASHDLKEPLRGIHNYANFLMEDYAQTLNEEGVAKLETLVRLTQRMEDLINSLLHFSRLGRAELNWQPVNLNEVMEQAIATLTMARPDLSIDFRIPQPLPTVEGDRSQVNELFTNLISNAIKYNDKADKWVEIGVMPGESLADHAAAVAPDTFYVRDNGIGIAPEHLDKVFQIFRRLHGRDEFGGGTGAGLTIARKIVERHGGHIWVESVRHQGTTFYFTLAPEVQR